MNTYFELSETQILELAFTLKNPECSQYLLNSPGPKYFWISDSTDEQWFCDIVVFQGKRGIVFYDEEDEILFIDDDECGYPSNSGMYKTTFFAFISTHYFNLTSWNKI